MITRQSGNERIIRLVILLVALVVITGCVSFGSANITIGDVYRIILSKIPLLSSFFDSSGISNAHNTIIMNIRLPRVLGGVFAGAVIAISGVVFQSVFRNPLADPYVLGISAGAALGATVSMILVRGTDTLGAGMLLIAGFGSAIGALASLLLSISLYGVIKKKGISVLLLSGIAVNYFFTSLITLLMSLNKDVVQSIYFWTLGSFSVPTWGETIASAAIFIVLLTISLAFSRDMDIMLMGDSTAVSVGVDVKKIRYTLLVLSSISTAAIISFFGIIGFVGIVIPHIARLLFGPGTRKLLLMSSLLGGVFLAVSDTIARTVISPAELPVGVVTALAGAPFFFYILVKGRKV